jgi:hypothetical protein
VDERVQRNPTLVILQACTIACKRSEARCRVNEPTTQESVMTNLSIKMLVMICLAAGAIAGCAAEPDDPEAATSVSEQELPAVSCDTEYYSDASMTQAVGGCTRLCNAGQTCYGQQTSYRAVVYCESCSGGGGGGCRTYSWGTICN